MENNVGGERQLVAYGLHELWRAFEALEAALRVCEVIEEALGVERDCTKLSALIGRAYTLLWEVLSESEDDLEGGGS